jgi:hypothetical protein
VKLGETATQVGWKRSSNHGSLTHARVALAEWRLDYNTSGRTAASATLPPVDDAKLSVQASKRDGTLRAIGAPRPVPPDSAGEIQARMPSTPPAGAACGRAPTIVLLLRSPTSAPADAQAETSSQPDTRGDFRDARVADFREAQTTRGNRCRSYEQEGRRSSGLRGTADYIILKMFCQRITVLYGVRYLPCEAAPVYVFQYNYAESTVLDQV